MTPTQTLLDMGIPEDVVAKRLQVTTALISRWRRQLSHPTTQQQFTAFDIIVEIQKKAHACIFRMAFIDMVRKGPKQNLVQKTKKRTQNSPMPFVYEDEL